MCMSACLYVCVCVFECASVSVCNYVLQFLTVLRLCHMPYVFAINAIMWNSTRLIKKLEAILIDMKRRQFGCEFHFWRYLRKFYFSDLQCQRIRKVNSLNVCLFAWTRMNMHACTYIYFECLHTYTKTNSLHSNTYRIISTFVYVCNSPAFNEKLFLSVCAITPAHAVNKQAANFKSVT